jgi:hypothetical protein
LFASAISAGCGVSTPTPVKPDAGQTSIDRAALRTKLAARRAETFRRFLAYREARVYPINNLPGGGFRHVWMDDLGNLCAAATLISGDWGRDATARAGADNNEIKLADVKSGVLHDWILQSGLTHHEIVAIQVPGFQWDPNEDREREREIEVTRLFDLYIDVERQLKSMWDESLEDAVDELMKRPELARQLLADQVAGPGQFAQPPVG